MNFLVVFDFDHTIVDCNSDIVVVEALGRGQLQKELMRERMQWTQMMSVLLSPFGESELRAAVRETVKLAPPMIQLFRLLHERKIQNRPASRVEVAIASDANVLFIEEALQHAMPDFAGAVVDTISSNPIVFFENTSSDTNSSNPTRCEVKWYTGESGHECRLCNAAGRPNICKSCIITSLLEKSSLVDPVVVFVGDGGNDHCPILQVLRSRDVCFVRQGLALDAKLCHGSSAGSCRKIFWDTADDLLSGFAGHVLSSTENRTSCLPPRMLFIEADGRADTFRANTLARRMPLLVQRLLGSNCAQWLENYGPEAVALRTMLLSSLADSARENGTFDNLVSTVMQSGAAAAHGEVVGAVLGQRWVRNFGRAWGDLPWLEGEVLFNVLAVLLAQALPWQGLLPSSHISQAFVISPHQPIKLSLHLMDGAFRSPIADVYAAEKHASVSAFLQSHIIPLVATQSRAWRDGCPNALRGVLENSLWGNAIDLSMFQLDHLTKRHHSSSDDAEQTEHGHCGSQHHNIVGDHLERIVSKIEGLFRGTDEVNPRSGVGVVDIIMDNVGLECVGDLMLSLWLIRRGIVAEQPMKVRLHVKPIPHYVSDTMPHDLDLLLGAIKDAVQRDDDAGMTEGVRAEAMEFVHQIESARPDSLEVHQDMFWASPGEFRNMQPLLADKFFFSHQRDIGTATFTVIPRSDLVIVKGDLNFRRLVGDRHWDAGTNSAGAPAGTSLTAAIGDFWPVHAVPVVALRTLKSEVCVGVDSAEIASLDHSSPDWRVSGKYAVALMAP